MRFTTRTEYGVVCMIYIAKHAGADKWVTIKEIASHENYPFPYIEKILQGLRQAKLLVSHQGNQGGYSLARGASEITLKEIVDALEGGTFEIFCAPATREDLVCTHFCLCGVKPIWRKTKDLLDKFYGSLTLDMLAKNELEVNSLVNG